VSKKCQQHDIFQSKANIHLPVVTNVPTIEKYFHYILNLNNFKKLDITQLQLDY